jgi:site-specific DNA-cytosine methylase
MVGGLVMGVVMKTFLDLCCGIGGITAGFDGGKWKRVGVDIVEQPDYCGEDFFRTDAIKFALEHGRKFDFIHISCPCQKHTTLTKGTNYGLEYTDIIPEARRALQSLNVPFMMENVVSAPIRKDLVLCGEMFGLDVIRHRVFELHRVKVSQPVHVTHRGRVAGWRHGVFYPGPYRAVYGDGGGKGSVPEWQEAMGINWSDSRYGIAQAVPPAYAKYISERVIEQI